MTTTKLILSSFCEASHLSPLLIRAVVRQFGGWESFTGFAEDVNNHGIDGGFHGFIYNADTEPFARRNRKLIAELAEQQAGDMGVEVSRMIADFGCFKGDNVTSSEVGRALYAGENMPNGVNILNALAWYAGEEVCRSYVECLQA